MCADDFILSNVPGGKFTAGLLFSKKTLLSTFLQELQILTEKLLLENPSNLHLNVVLPNLLLPNI